MVSGLARKGRLVAMTELRIFLWWVFVAFTIICLAFCIEAHVRYRTKRGIDDDQGFDSRYEYFGQPVYDQRGKVYGYELLLRAFDSQNHRWYLPTDVIDFPLSRMVYAVSEIDPYITSKIKVLALNMTVNQISDFRAEYFFKWAQGMVGDRRLSVELNDVDICRARSLQRQRMRIVLKRLDHARIQVAIENVDSSKRMWRRLRGFLPYIDYLKFDASAFNKSADHWIDVTLAQWQWRAQEHRVVPVVGKVEDNTQVELANQLGINLRQGYAYGHPGRVREMNDGDN